MEFVSSGIEKLTGYPPRAFRAGAADLFSSMIHPLDRPLVAERIALALEAQRPFQVTYRIVTASGEIRWVSETGDAARDSAGNVIALEGFIADISRAANADAELVEQASLLEKAQDAIFVMDMNSRITFWNRGAQRLYGWTAAEAIGRSCRDLLRPEMHGFGAAYDATLLDGEWNGEMQQCRHDGSVAETEARWTLLRPDESARVPQKILVISADIGERKNIEARIVRLAFFDVLTDLPNRSNLLDQLRRALLNSARSQQIGVLMFCDLDNFKALNDSQGHAAGDALLQAVARRLDSCVRKTDLVARLGGDEFVILMQPVGNSYAEAARHAEAVSENVLAAMASPFHLAEHVHAVAMSIGITLFCGTHDTVESVMQKADAAMYQAKSAGRNTARFFDPVIQASMANRFHLERALRQGLIDKEFVLYYQPQISVSGAVIGAEALIRWRQADGKLILPGEFIKAAESMGLIVDLGNWVLATACAQLAAWSKSEDMSGFTLSVNVSARQFVEPEFVSMAMAILRESGVDPRQIKMELTESLLVADVGTTAAKMEDLKQLGVSFALDDFGTGYSSLAYLRTLPLDQLKIDHTFMRDVLTDRNDASIVRSIIGLAGSLGLQVIAEGVETIGQRQFLSDAGCYAYQGFLYEQAIPGDQFARYARTMH